MRVTLIEPKYSKTEFTIIANRDVALRLLIRIWPTQGGKCLAFNLGYL